MKDAVKEKTKKLKKKYKRVRFLVNTAAVIAVCVMTVYSMIPKDEKFDSLDTEILAETGEEEIRL